MGEILIAILGGTALAALINQVGEYVRQRRSQKFKIDDAECADMTALKQAMKYVLFDRIMWLGQGYIRDGEISFDDRRRLNDMHSVYHKGLGGNGDLNTLMEEINNLKLKV